MSLLSTLATLSGYTSAGPLAGLYPDVSRLHPQTGERFLADAKATELPTCGETRRRLVAYLRSVRGDVERAALLICHGPETTHASWLEALVDVTEHSRLVVLSSFAEVIGGDRLTGVLIRRR